MPPNRDRLPYVEYVENGQKVNIQNKVQKSAFHLLLLCGKATDTVIQTFQNAAEAFDGGIVVDVIPLAPETEALYDALGVQNSGSYLVRPDQFVAYRSARLNVEQFEDYLEQFLLKSEASRTIATAYDVAKKTM
jgi:hypothetical protein